MKNNDTRIITKILRKRGREDLASLLVGARGEVDESSTYGNYLFSTISQYLFYLPLDNYDKIRNLSDEDKEVLLSSVLDLYPHQAEAPEIRGVDFRLLREEGFSDELDLQFESRLSHEFAREQLIKAEEKIKREDYDGAISSAGSLLEGVFEDIYKRCTGKDIDTTADLRQAYKKVSRLLKLSDEQYSNESVQAIMRGLSGVISGLDAIRNQMGDRHRRLTKPWRQHARLCVNSAKIVVDFLYETLETQQQKVQALYEKLTGILDSSKRFLKREELITDQEILNHLSEYDEFLKVSVKDAFISKFEINRFRDSDIFFSAMAIFLDQLTEDDITKISKEQKNNNQACGLSDFLSLVKAERPVLVTKEIDKYLDSTEVKDNQLV